MKPITRKELYLNKIVGNNDYEIPEKPITTEEFFFAEILGEAVQAPEPLTRYQMYLAKIAGRDIEIPYPETRLEYFLAKAAGMNIETPTPITREEIYWSNYTAIVEFEVENVPPLTYKAIEGTLKNYRIYGNTVNGESVGDMTANLFDGEIIMGYHLAPDTGLPTTRSMRCAIMAPIQLTSQQVTITYEYDDDNEHCAFMYSLFNDDTLVRRVAVVNNGYLYSGTVIDVSDGNCIYLSFFLENQTSAIDIDLLHSIMLNSGSTALPYEPYGYKVPVTVNSGTVNIYLDEQIVKSGDDADYIDYATQKRYNADGTTVDVELPTLQTVEGTNTLSVGTEVQPSKVYIKGEKERE